MKNACGTFLVIAVSACGSGGGGGSGGGAGGAWKVHGDDFFTGITANNYSISVDGGVVAVGYWDTGLDQPAVQEISVDGGEWSYACGGPVPMDGVAKDELAYTSFRFRRDGARSVVGFNRSLADPEFMLFACDGGGAWEPLPSVPLAMVPGYTGGVTSFDQTFTFDVRAGEVFAVLNSDESTWPDEKTCLSLFVHDGAAWGLMSERVCYPRAPESFGYVNSHSYVSAEAGAAGLYAGYFLREDATGLTSANVSYWNGAAWSWAAGPKFFPLGTSSYSLTEFSLRVFDDGGQDGLVMSVGGTDDEQHVFVYRAGSWEELPTAAVKGGPGTRASAVAVGNQVALAFSDCCTGVDGVTVKRYDSGDWDTVGSANFTDITYEFYDDVLATDGVSLFVVYQTSIDWDGEDTAGRLSVMRHAM